MKNTCELNFLHLLLPLAKNKQKITKNFQDDCAYINIKSNKNLIISTDSLVETHHILSKCGHEAFAKKLFFRTISDILCKNATPLYYTLNIFLPLNFDFKNIECFMKALQALGKKYNIFLIGGDTSKSTSVNFIASMTIFAKPNDNNQYLRLGAKSGDGVYISGIVGAGYIAYLQILHGQLKTHPDYTKMQVSQKISQTIFANFKVNASTDVSDGLFAEIAAMQCLGKLKFNININSLPLAKPLVSLVKNKKIDLNLFHQNLQNTRANDVFEAPITHKNNTLEDFNTLQKIQHKQFNAITQQQALSIVLNAIKFGDDCNILFTSKNILQVKQISCIGVISKK